jgi:uncharacterized membrane protein
VSRLRAGEWTAAFGAAALLVTLFLPWFVPLEVVFVTTGQTSGNAESGWSSLGWVTIVFCIAAIAIAAWLAVANATNRPVAQAVAASALTATVGSFALVALALRVLVFQPGPNALTTIRYGAYLGLLAALVLAVGGWLAIKDDRTDAPESAYTPPEPRPAPPGA